MMRSRLFVLAPIVLAFLAPPAPAGIFSRKPKPNSAERVPELLTQLKSHADEDTRQSAAEELRQYDPNSFPGIVPGLIDALGRDSSAAVRSEAASSLGRIRPISQQAGFALEQAQSNDSSIRVRLSTRQALLQYHFVGYRSGKPDAPAPGANANGGNATSNFRPSMPNGKHPGVGRETAEPPLAPPIVVPPPSTLASRQANVSPPPVQPIPANAPRLLPTPKTDAPIVAPATPNNGPALPPPT